MMVDRGPSYTVNMPEDRWNDVWDDAFSWCHVKLGHRCQIWDDRREGERNWTVMGTTFFFNDPNDAFEFKIRWA